MDVTLSAIEVAPGGSITITVAVRNDRPVPVVVGPSPDGWACGGVAAMSGGLTFPLDPPGRDWDGVAGRFKRYALTEGRREGGAPMGQPFPVYTSRTGRCLDSSSDFTIEPGATATESMVWSALLAPGLPARPGTVPISVSVSHDPTGTPPSYPADWQGLIGMWSKTYERLTVQGTLDIVGEAPPIITTGQAIDALLSDQRFTTWLAKEPTSTWSGVNVLLQDADKAQGIVPAGQSWEIDLFREHNVPRTWAIGFVDAYSGTLLNLAFCDAPCDR